MGVPPALPVPCSANTLLCHLRTQPAAEGSGAVFHCGHCTHLQLTLPLSVCSGTAQPGSAWEATEQLAAASGGAPVFEGPAWNSNTVDLIRLARAHCLLVLHRTFADSVQRLGDEVRVCFPVAHLYMDSCVKNNLLSPQVLFNMSRHHHTSEMHVFPVCVVSLILQCIHVQGGLCSDGGCSGAGACTCRACCRRRQLRRCQSS